AYAWAGRTAGVPVTVVMPAAAVRSKVDACLGYGAEVILHGVDVGEALLEMERIRDLRGLTYCHPFDDPFVIAGHGSIGLEILEDLPDVDLVVVGVGGGGLISGVGSAIRALAPDVRILGAEPETAAPGAVSFAAGGPRVFEGWQATFVDGAGGKSIFPRMWERMQGVVDGSIVVTLDEVKRAMRLVAEKVRVIAEGAGALGVAAALSGKAGDGPIVAVVSGGNIDLKKFAELVL
ncbi:MAG: pyridoxal-phosphate dependent enzyme, partial [bacterium]